MKRSSVLSRPLEQLKYKFGYQGRYAWFGRQIMSAFFMILSKQIDLISLIWVISEILHKPFVRISRGMV